MGTIYCYASCTNPDLRPALKLRIKNTEEVTWNAGGYFEFYFEFGQRL